MSTVIAIDLGASSGRVMKVSFNGDSFQIQEAHRFPNNPVQGKHLYWDVGGLWKEIQTGINKAKDNALCLGIDTWGVDYGLLDINGDLVDTPVHYRDPRTRGMMKWVFQRVPRRTIFQRTGIQFLELNTLYQLSSQVKQNDVNLQKAVTYLGLPDLFNYWMTGTKKAEFTHATTTQCYNPMKRGWDHETLEQIGVPPDIFPEVINPGIIIGEYKGVQVCAPASHDTGSAIVAIPTVEENYAYISSGTWSLIGTETKKPQINDDTYRLNFTNEGGVENTFRLLKNLAGLWMEQELLREWREKGLGYHNEDLIDVATQAHEFRSFIDPDHPLFHDPGPMTIRIDQYCKNTGQLTPTRVCEYVRCVYESLALSYRQVLGELRQVSGKSIDVVHVIGGGSQNYLLSQMTANAMDIRVVSGPVEATALGNGVVQLISQGLVKNVREARRILSETLPVKEYLPSGSGDWDSAYERFKEIKETGK